jgi:hypothetical protein
VNIFNQHHAFSPHPLVPPFFNIAYYSVLLADFELELENDPEVVEDLKTQNATAATFKYFEERLMAEIDYGFEMLMKESLLVIQKVKSDAAVGLYSNKSEKQQPPATAAKKTRRKRGKRRPLNKANANTSPGTVDTEAAVCGSTRAKRDDALTNPKGKIRVEVFSAPNCRSPHEGLVCLLEPQKNAKARRWKIGRSTAKDFKEFGVSLYNDLGVSTKHAVLTQVDKQYYIEDMGSGNGTMHVASGMKISPLVPFKLADGTRLQMGQSILKFNFSAE